MGKDEQLAKSGIETVERAWFWAQDNSVTVLVYVAVAIALYFALVLFRALLRKIVGKPEKLEPNSWRELLARMLQRTRSFFLAAISIELVTLSINAPPSFHRTVAVFFMIAVVLQGAIWLREFVIAIIGRRAALEEDDNSTFVSAMGVIRLIVNVAIWATAVILILDNLGVDVTALVAGLGIGGIAIGLAAQGIFSDLFAALAILFDKPFKKGDTINIGDLTGTVEAIGLKTTRLRAISGELVSVSNAKLLEERIRNYALFNRRRVVLGLGVIYQTPVEVLEKLPGEIEQIVRRLDNVSFDRAHIWNFGDSSIDFEIVFFVNTDSYFDMMQARQNIMLAIMRRFEVLEIDFAYPTQMGFLAGVDGKAVDPLAAPPELRPAP